MSYSVASLGVYGPIVSGAEPSTEGINSRNSLMASFGNALSGLMSSAGTLSSLSGGALSTTTQ
jgi:hypothetical protein